jgi:uncharacterized protein
VKLMNRLANGSTFFKRDPLTSIAALVGIFFTSQILAGIMLSFYPLVKGWSSGQSETWLTNSVAAQFLFVLLTEVYAVWIVIWLINKAKVAWQRIGLVRPVLRDIGFALLGYLVYFAAYLLIIVLINRFSLIDLEQEQQIGFEGSKSRTDIMMVFASLVILPPLAEEIMFRGFLFSSLRTKLNFMRAAAVTSVLFGLVHLQFGSGAPLLWAAALDTFVLSAVLCYLRERSASLWPCILLHAIKNGIAFSVLLSQGKL